MLIKKISYIEMSPETYISINAEGGSIKQIYSAASGQYFPDRSLAPLVLTPIVGWNDSASGQASTNAAAQLVDGHWYRLSDETTGGLVPANEISPGDKFSIDTNTGSKTYGRLTIRENTPATSPVTYIFVATLNVGAGRKVMKAVRCSTKGVAVLPEMMFDNAAQALYDPWSGNPTYTITPAITPSSYSATYRWQALHGSTWNDVGKSHYDWALSVNTSNGALTIKRTIMQDELKLKCIAIVNVDGVNVDIERSISHARRLAPYECDIRENAAILPGTKSVKRSLVVRSAKGEITNPDDELQISWYGAGQSPIAIGAEVMIPISALGSSMELGVDPQDRGGWKAAELENGNWLTDADGKTLIIR